MHSLIKSLSSTALFVISLSTLHAEAPQPLPSSRPKALHDWNLFAEGDWLYWKANETGLGYALNQEGFDPNHIELMGFGDVVNPHFYWESGFRLGLGYNFPRDQWTLQLLWTWYEGKAGGSITTTKEEGAIIYPSLLHPNFFNDQNIFSTNQAKSNLLIHLNVLDLDLCREFKTGKHLSLKPRVGIRSAWINQNYDISYQDLTYYDPTSKEILPALNLYTTNMTNNFWGLGPFSGLDTNWNLGKGFSLFGDFSIALLYGSFDISQSENFVATGGEGLILSEKNNFHAGRAVTDLQLGIRWQSSFAKDRFRFLVQGGWDHHMFFSQNQMFHFVSGQNWGVFVQNQGDLYFQGWNLSTGFYY